MFYTDADIDDPENITRKITASIKEFSFVMLHNALKNRPVQERDVLLTELYNKVCKLFVKRSDFIRDFSQTVATFVIIKVRGTQRLMFSKTLHCAAELCCM